VERSIASKSAGSARRDTRDGDARPELELTFSVRKRQGAWRDALLRRLLAYADVLAVLAALVTLGLAHGGFGPAAWALLSIPLWIVLAKVLGLYDLDRGSLRHLTVDELPRLLVWMSLGVTATTVVISTSSSTVSVETAALVWLVGSLMVFVLRAAARVHWRRVTPLEQVVVVGDGPQAHAVRRKFELFPDMHATVVAELKELDVDELRGSPALLAGAGRILVATWRVEEEQVSELVGFCRSSHIKLSVVPPGRGMFGRAAQLDQVADLPVLEYNTWDLSRSTMLLKRIFDASLAALALLVLSPVLVGIAVAILLDTGRPIFFAQTRAGQFGRPFRMLKFRTMVADAEEILAGLISIETLEPPMFKLRDDPRVTRVGHFLRRTSLDELPQLINVLKGDMSIVGPRPEQVELVARYSDADRFLLAVKPGLTGPMQIYGRAELTFVERRAVERDYVENISVGRDLRILALTVAPVVSGRGAF
jgi:exopolysaccharide biosynthesis polyprenyl glycosylphosphotransferase